MSDPQDALAVIREQRIKTAQNAIYQSRMMHRAGSQEAKDRAMARAVVDALDAFDRGEPEPTAPMPAPFAASNCRSCGAPIFHAPTAAGKTIPVDLEPNNATGNIVIRDRIAKVLTRAAMGNDPEPGEVRYLSHFATCPGAKDWRKR